MLFIAYILFLEIAASVKGQPTPTDAYTHKATLREDSLIIHWKFTETVITFEVHGHTLGWVGIGFSSNGAMTNADMYVGWVKEGKVKVTDRHGADSNTFPPIDADQNINILGGFECDGWTVFKFSRYIAACEMEHDRGITTSTERLIWAYGETDPVNDDIIPANYHRFNRGSESMYFFESGPSADLPAGAEYKTFDLVAEDFHVPAEHTYYNCKTFRVPDVDGKRHIVKIDPIIQPGNERYVHHIVVTVCVDNLESSSELGVDIRCRAANMPEMPACISIIAAWAIGGGSMVFPEQAGFSFGAPGDPVYIRLETHYDNQQYRSDIVDSSGLRFTYTDSVREYDVGILEVGNTAIGALHFIPPGAKNFLSVGYCAGKCLEQRMNVSGVKEVTVFSAMLHSHLAGRAMKLRHFRNGVELPYLQHDASYDFNYQETRYVDPPAKLMSTDVLRMECIYNTEDHTEMLEGGEGTQQEMCLGFLVYYPKIDLALCSTAASSYESWPYFGIMDVNSTGAKESLRDFTVTEPEKFRGKTAMQVMSEYNWTEENIAKFERDYLAMTQQQMCVPGNASETTVEYYWIPKTTSEYEPPIKMCPKHSKSFMESVDAEVCSVGTRSSHPCGIIALILCLVSLSMSNYQ